MKDVIYAVRSDEVTHRFVNHSLANLDHSEDINPFALREPDMHVKGKKLWCVFMSIRAALQRARIRAVVLIDVLSVFLASRGRNPRSTSRSRQN